MSDKKIIDKIEFLFNRKWDEDLTEDQADFFQKNADKLVEKYGWKTVFSELFSYIQENYKTPDEIINFANIYFSYGWQELPIENPYEFLGYLYYVIDLNPIKYDAEVIFDTLSSTILPKAGYKNADLFLNMDYIAEKDPKMIDSVNNYRKTIE